MRAAAVLFFAAIVAGLLSTPSRIAAPARIGEYRVLVGDFHVHMMPLDEATLAPWDAVLEARRRGLDVIALTGHNQTCTARVGRWFARLTGGPMVLVGEEVLGPSYDMIAVGIERSVDFRGTAAESIARIHEQGGVAIAAHPLRPYWPAYDEAAMAGLDGAEVLHPMAFVGSGYAAELRRFYERKTLTAVGSSDFHGLGHMGFSRTYVFVREATSRSVVEALREHRTVAVDRDGRMYGDDAILRQVEASGGLPRSGVEEPPGAWSQISRLATLGGMLIAVFVGFAPRRKY